MPFDKKKYDAEYKKINYIKPTVRFKPDLYQEIANYCEWNMMSINEFINSAAAYIIKENIDIKGYK